MKFKWATSTSPGLVNRVPDVWILWASTGNWCRNSQLRVVHWSRWTFVKCNHFDSIASVFWLRSNVKYLNNINNFMIIGESARQLCRWFTYCGVLSRLVWVYPLGLAPRLLPSPKNNLDVKRSGSYVVSLTIRNIMSAVDLLTLGTNKKRNDIRLGIYISIKKYVVQSTTNSQQRCGSLNFPAVNLWIKKLIHLLLLLLILRIFFFIELYNVFFFRIFLFCNFILWTTVCLMMCLNYMFSPSFDSISFRVNSYDCKWEKCYQFRFPLSAGCMLYFQ